MPRTLPAAIAALFTLVSTPPAGAQQPQPQPQKGSEAGADAGPVPRPDFAQGDLSKVTCKIAAQEETGPGSQRITIEIHNRSKHRFEPTVWQVRAVTAAEKYPLTPTIERVPLPRAFRIGRSVAPNKKMRFAIQVGSPALEDLSVTVTDGIFCDGSTPLDASPVTVRGIAKDTVQDRAQGQSIAVSRVELSNGLGLPVDVILRAKTTAPKDGEFLLTASLGANETKQVTFTSTPVQLDWHDPAGYPGIRIEAVDVVDWSARLPGDPTAAANLLRPAYENWLRWDPDALPAFRGRFTLRDFAQNTDTETMLEGAFVMDARGRIDTDGATDEARSKGKAAIERMLENLVRPSWDELAAANGFDMAAHNWVTMEGPGWSHYGTSQGTTVQYDAQGGRGPVATVTPTHPVFAIEGSRITSSRLDDGSFVVPWTTRPMGAGYVVTRRVLNQGSPYYEHDYRRLGPHVVPTRSATVFLDTDNNVIMKTTIALSDLSLATGVEIADDRTVPTGAAADALRALWDGIYRYPDSTVPTLTANFEVTTPGTDNLWRNQRKVAGTVRFKDFGGFGWARTKWTDAAVGIDGALPPTTVAALVHTYLDRITMWCGRDPSALGTFDEVFLGAVVEQSADGSSFTITDGPARTIAVRDSAIASIVWSWGATRRYVWKTTEHGLLAKAIHTGNETITAKWRKIEDGLWLPVDIVFERVFGDDWGPERIKLSKVKVAR